MSDVEDESAMHSALEDPGDTATISTSSKRGRKEMTQHKCIFCLQLSTSETPLLHQDPKYYGLRPWGRYRRNKKKQRVHPPAI